MMIGLPDSTKIDEIRTARQLIKLKPKMVRIYPVLVIKGTELEEEMNKGEYVALTVQQAVDRTKEVMNMFNNKKIEVIRIGLQNTDTITDPENPNSEVVAGPYHPAFRQLVEGSMWYDVIVSKIKKFSTKVKKIEILANEASVNNIIGHKKENILKLKDTYDVETVVKSSDKIKPGRFEIKVLENYTDFQEE